MSVIDPFSAWIEVFLNKHEMAQVVARKLLEDILPMQGFSAMVRSDNVPAFVSQLSQNLATALGERLEITL